MNHKYIIYRYTETTKTTITTALSIYRHYPQTKIPTTNHTAHCRDLLVAVIDAPLFERLEWHVINNACTC